MESDALGHERDSTEWGLECRIVVAVWQQFQKKVRSLERIL